MGYAPSLAGLLVAFAVVRRALPGAQGMSADEAEDAKKGILEQSAVTLAARSASGYAAA
jgi:hypothetical protein